MAKPKLVALTGAGISVESGLSTFRDAGGLWDNYPVEDVATPEGLARNPELVLNFYNGLRAKLQTIKPNDGHMALVRLEQYFDVHVVTQNVDNLHEQAGSKQVVHLHGELTKVRSIANENLIYDIGYKSIKIGDKAEDGQQLRPHIVFFGEGVPEMERAIPLAEQADVFVVIGTSLNVYPAAGLLRYPRREIPKFIIDPKMVPYPNDGNYTFIQKSAGEGGRILEQKLKELYHLA